MVFNTYQAYKILSTWTVNILNTTLHFVNILLGYLHYNCQVLEGKDVAYTMDGFNRLFMEATVDMFIYLDEEDGLIGALSRSWWFRQIENWGLDNDDEGYNDKI